MQSGCGYACSPGAVCETLSKHTRNKKHLQHIFFLWKFPLLSAVTKHDISRARNKHVFMNLTSSPVILLPTDNVNILSPISLNMQVVRAAESWMYTQTLTQLPLVCTFTHTHTDRHAGDRCLPVITAVREQSRLSLLLSPPQSLIGQWRRRQLSLSQLPTSLCLCEKLSSSFAWDNAVVTQGLSSPTGAKQQLKTMQMDHFAGKLLWKI